MIKSQLSIFNTFRTKSQLTGEAKRQRSIITHLATDNPPAEKTRTAISKKIASKSGIAWKNIYSGIFRDIDEVLLPLKIAEEAGRLPLKRGPKALQEKGIPYYQLTDTGKLVALSIKEVANKGDLLKEIFSKSNSEDKEFYSAIQIVSAVTPTLIFSLFEKYVEAFCKGDFEDLLPFTLSKLKNTIGDTAKINRELLEGYLMLTKSDKEKMLKFLEDIT